MSRAVLSIDVATETEERFLSIADAVRAGYTRQCIYDVINGNQATHKGRVWYYVYSGNKKDNVGVLKSADDNNRRG